MHRPKVMTVYGTRPEAIKVAPVIKGLAVDDRFRSTVVSTGQHREMLAQVNSMFKINPDYDLDLMKHGQSLNELVSRCLIGLDEIITAENPDAIIVQGDTSTAMAAAHAAFHKGVKIVHLEAGLRSGSIFNPFPEEANRRVVAQLASLHLAPTGAAKDNLRRENFHSVDIAITGNTVIDALVEAAKWTSGFQDGRLEALANTQDRVVLVTTHRRENLNVMTEIGAAVRDLAVKYPSVYFALPLHLNPLVRNVVMPKVENLDNVIVTDPLPYDQFVYLLSRSAIVLTDSGGVQEEAPSLGKPVLVMRNNTERPEAVSAGTVKLVGTNRSRIVAEASLLLDNQAAYEAMANAVNPYGDGRASERTIAAVADLLGVGERLPDFFTE